jgi:replicative DNA helicase
VVIAAAVNSGKTTLAAAEATHMISQMPEGKEVMWFNNEGQGSLILRRCIQSALGATEEEIDQLREKKTLLSTYANAIGGVGRVRVFDAHASNTSRIEQLLQAGNPGVIVFDMLDNVKHSFGSMDRPETGLEAIYQWARELGVRFNAVVIATSQLSADGYSTPFPDMRSLKGAKIGKQGAADVIITMGQSADEGMPSVRYIGTPKVKRPRAGTNGQLRAEVMMDMHRGRLVGS